MSSGSDHWEKAKTLIPGGNMLLSKRPELHLPGFWPTYYSRAKGCKIWDLDNRELTDFSFMGIGTNVLGYSHDEIDEAVLSVVKAGNMCTLNAPEEVELASKLVEIHPWAHMARFARTGGEANAIAVRLARSFTGKDKVAICGYHGWHDWYLATNLGKGDGLGAHLLPGLATSGVPKALKETIFPFSYNDYEQLKDIVETHDIGVIKMEVMRNFSPKDDFLGKVRKLATEKEIVLIFDECTTGFRETYGGLHKRFNIDPDIAVFGKALGNGYAITAVIGKREIMQEAQSTFISSTFWTERIGSVAALKTLEVMQKFNTFDQIKDIGAVITDKLKALCANYDLDIEFSGLPGIINFTLGKGDQMAYKTFIAQEMLKRGFLASRSVYVSIAHTPDIIESYLESMEEVIKQIKRFEDGDNILSYLDGEVCQTGFQRLN